MIKYVLPLSLDDMDYKMNSYVAEMMKSANVENLLAAYNPMNAVSKETLKDAAIRFPKITRGPFASAYPCYKINSGENDKFVFYYRDPEGTDDVAAMIIKTSDQNWTTMDAHKNSANPEEQARFSKFYELWKTSAMKDIGNKNPEWRVTQKRIGDVLWKIIITQIARIRHANVPTGDSPYKMRRVPERIDAGLDAGVPPAAYELIKNDRLNINEFNKALDIKSYREFYNKAIGTLYSRMDNEARSADAKLKREEKLDVAPYHKWKFAINGYYGYIAHQLLVMGLNREATFSDMSNEELMEVFNDTIQEHPYASADTKSKWAEFLMGLRTKTGEVGTQELSNPKGEYSGPEIKAEGFDTRKAIRVTLYMMINNFILKAFGEGSPDSAMHAKRAEKMRPDIVDEAQIIPTFKEYNMILEGGDEYLDTPEDIYNAEYNRRLNVISKGAKFHGLAQNEALFDKHMEELVKTGLFPGRYVTRRDDPSALREVIFDNKKGYIVVYMDNKRKEYRGIYVPAPEYASDVISTYSANADDVKAKNISLYQKLQAKYLQYAENFMYLKENDAKAAREKGNQRAKSLDLMPGSTFMSKSYARGSLYKDFLESMYRAFKSPTAMTHATAHTEKKLAKDTRGNLEGGDLKSAYDTANLSNDLMNSLDLIGYDPEYFASNSTAVLAEETLGAIYQMKSSSISQSKLKLIFERWKQATVFYAELTGADTAEILGLSIDDESSAETAVSKYVEGKDKQLMEAGKRAKIMGAKNRYQQIAQLLHGAVVNNAPDVETPAPKDKSTYIAKLKKFINPATYATMTMADMWKGIMSAADDESFDMPEALRTEIRSELATIGQALFDEAGYESVAFEEFVPEYPMDPDDVAEVHTVLSGAQAMGGEGQRIDKAVLKDFKRELAMFLRSKL